MSLNFLSQISWQVQKEKIKTLSLRKLFNYLLFRLFKTRVMKFYYLSKEISIDEINEKLIDFDLDVKELSYNDFLLGDKSVFKNEKLNVIKKRCLDSTYKAYGLIENNELIYSTWISFKTLGLPVPCKIKLNENEALLEDSYCHPNFRGKGLHSKMNVYRLKKIYESGRNKAVVIVLNGNEPALKVQKKSGFKIDGTFYAGYIFGITFNTLRKDKYEN